MRLTHLALACLTTLSALPVGVRAETAQEKFERLISTPGNTEALAYSETRIFGPDLVSGNKPFEGFDDVFGEGSVSLRRTAAGGLAEANAETSFGGVKMAHEALRGETSATADSNGGFRDVWTLGGGTGTGTLEVRGVIDGSSSGQFGTIQTNASLAIIGSGQPWSALAGVSMVAENGSFTLAFDCRDELNSSCDGSSAAGSARATWRLAVPFEFGDSVSFAQRMFTSTFSTGAEAGQVGVATGIADIVLPAGATLTSSSGRVALSDGVWVYADRPITPVPEPGTWALMAVGLATLLRFARR